MPGTATTRASTRHNPEVPDIGAEPETRLTLFGQQSFVRPLASDPNAPPAPIALDVHGKIGQTVFQATRPLRSNRSHEPRLSLQRRRHVIPHDPRTHAQLLCRSRFASAVRSWWTLTDLERQAYNLAGAQKQPPLEGLNLHIRAFILVHPLDEFQLEAERRAAQIEIPFDGPGP